MEKTTMFKKIPLFTYFFLAITATHCSWLERAAQNFVSHAGQDPFAGTRTQIIDTPINATDSQKLDADKTTIDFSTIKKLSDLDDGFPESGSVAIYRGFPEGKELFFFLDEHYDFMCREALDNLIKKENFHSCIIEAPLVFTLHYNNPAIDFNTFMDPFLERSAEEDFSARRAHRLFKEQGKVVIPGEHATLKDMIAAYQNEGLSLKDILVNIIFWHSEALESTLIESLFGTTAQEVTKFISDMDEAQKREFFERTEIACMFSRDKKIAETISTTMKKVPANAKVLVVYGANHYLTQEDFLKANFGEPTCMDIFEYYPQGIEFIKNLMQQKSS